jgi:hypothetical protein
MTGSTPADETLPSARRRASTASRPAGTCTEVHHAFEVTRRSGFEVHGDMHRGTPRLRRSRSDGGTHQRSLEVHGDMYRRTCTEVHHAFGDHAQTVERISDRLRSTETCTDEHAPRYTTPSRPVPLSPKRSRSDRPVSGCASIVSADPERF